MRNAERRMDEILALLLDRLDDFRMRMAHIQHADAADEIDIALAFNVPQFRALGARRVNPRF